MPLSDLPWWRWRARIRSALHMLSDLGFQQRAWLEGGRAGYGDPSDAVYRLVEDSWLDRWSAEKYVGSVFRDSAEAVAVNAAVLRVLLVVHQVGEDAPAAAYLAHPDWSEAVRAAREAHHRLAVADGDDPQSPPLPLDELARLTARG
ncbi:MULTISPECIES: hypothetical protein [Kitasatospora]|uniref:Uncharacterized protein n=1 Tax=Kitasatospora setae (strain ATCC 33774 / DSM 43861 / JCM 3304 / KCC A-0304 / NBRC 14216 / KM-6054) TaxID=452652 RepID=E4NFI7_KITSK|nr:MULTISPECIES: hypothetical protein [Kitasatospora]BAJ30267.1 hypothetical protein KSE_44840 [Kitasatospora setae KM-6054]